MKEGENSRPVTADEWSEHISEFAHNSEFGTPQYYAINDFSNLQDLYAQTGVEYHSDLPEVNGEANMTRENRTNLMLQRIALLEHTIEQNQARIPGYSSAYLEMSISFQHMVSAAASEARVIYSKEEDKQTAYIKKVYDETLDYIRNSASSKQNP